MSTDDQDWISKLLQNPLMGIAAGLLQASGPSREPVSFGQALGNAAQTAQGFQTYGVQNALQNMQLQRQRQLNSLMNGGNLNDPNVLARIALASGDTGGAASIIGRQTHPMTPDEKKKYGIPEGSSAVLNNYGDPQILTGSKQYEIVDPKNYKGLGLQPLPPGYAWQHDTVSNQYVPIGVNNTANTTDSPYNDTAIDDAATVVMSDPARMRDYASYGQTGQSTRVAINNRISQRLKDAGMTSADLVALRSKAHAQVGNLNTLTKQQAQLNAADQLVHANGDRLLQLFDLVDQTGIPMIEGIRRSLKAKAGGVNEAELGSVLTAFQTEVARMLSGNPNMTGVVSDSLRDEIMKMAPGNMSTAQAKRIINRLYLETSIRQQAVNDQLNAGVQQTVVTGQQPTQSQQPQQVQDPLGIR